MKTLLLALSVAFGIAVVATMHAAPGPMQTVNSLSELSLIPNPLTVASNTFVVTEGVLGDGTSSIWTFVRGATNTPGTNCIVSATMPAAGRFIRNTPGGGVGGTNIFNTTIITNLTVINNITLAGTNVASINPTIGRVPVKATTNSFADSPFYLVASNKVQTIFYGTNVMFTFDATVTNAPAFIVDDIAGNSVRMGLNAGGNGLLSSSSGVIYAPGVIAAAASLMPATPEVTGLGEINNSGGQWGQLIAKNHYAVATGNGTTNYSRLNWHSTTNGIGVIDFQNSGSGTPLDHFSFQSNGTEVATMTASGAVNGWTLTGGTNLSTAATVSAPVLISKMDSRYYGTVGNGSANDGAALQSALNNVGTNSLGWLHIPTGIYNITNTLLVPTGVKVYGDGIGKTIIREVDGARGYSTINGAPIVATLAMVAVSNASVSHLTVDHSATTNSMNGIVVMSDGTNFLGTPSLNCSVDYCSVLGGDSHQYLIWVHSGENVHIAHNLVDGMGGTNTSQEGIEIYGGTNIWITDNTVKRVGNASINVSAGVENVWVQNNTSSDSRTGVAFQSAFEGGQENVRNVEITGNIIRNASLYGVYGNNQSNCVIANVNIDRNIFTNAAMGVYLYGEGTSQGGTNDFDAISVTRNLIVGATNATLGAISVAYWRNTQIKDNILVAPQADGITVQLKSHNVTIAGNKLRDTLRSAVYGDSGCTNLTIRDNEVIGYHTGGGSVSAYRVANATNLVFVGNIADIGGWAEGYPAFQTYATCKNVLWYGNSLRFATTDRTDTWYPLATNLSYGTFTAAAGTSTAITNAMINMTRAVTIRQLTGTPLAGWAIAKNSPVSGAFTITFGAAAAGTETFEFEFVP